MEGSVVWCGRGWDGDGDGVSVWMGEKGGQSRNSGAARVFAKGEDRAGGKTWLLTARGGWVTSS